MAMMDSPTTITPVFDQATNVVLGNIYNYLKGQQDNSRATREITERLDRINGTTESESRSRGVNDRATAAALRGIADNQRKDNTSRGNNDRATQAALKGIIGNQKKDANAQSRDRATQKALFGNIDRNTRNMSNALGKFKDAMTNAFQGLKSFLSPFLDKSLKSFTDLSKTMRKANMTRAQKDQIQGMASSAIGDVESMFDGLQVSRDDINDFMSDLIASGKDLTEMSADQRASYIALRKRGMADEEAFDKAMSATSAQLKDTVLAMGDPAIAATLKKATSGITNAMANVAGGTDKAMAQMTANVRGIEAELGQALNPDTASKLATVMFKLKNNMADQMTEEEKALNIVIGGATDAKQAAEMLKKADTATLARMGIVPDNLANIQNFQQAGSSLGKNVRPDEENRIANSQNTTNGKVQQTFDKLIASLDKSTGGLVGRTANILDEYLGDSADIGALVKNGFKLVTLSLKTIAFNTGFFGKALMGLGGAAAIVALVANWDKIKPKLAEMLPQIKDAISTALKNIGPFLKSLVADFKKNVGPFVKDIISGVKSLLPNFGNDIKGAMSGIFDKKGASSKASGMASSMASAASDIDLSDIGSSIGGALKDIVTGIGDLLGGSSSFFKGILDGVANVISSLMPSLSNIVHDVVDCINRLIDAIAPYIQPIIQAVQSVIDIVSKAVDYVAPYIPQIVDAVKDITLAIVNAVPPIVDSLRDIVNNAVFVIGDIINNTVNAVRDAFIAITPAINFIGEAIDVVAKSLAPLLPKIVDTVDYGIRTLLPPLVNKIIPDLLALFRKILPPILDVVKRAVDVILPPVLNILKIIAENIMPPIARALDAVVRLVDKIANFLVDTLERIVNIILDVLEPILRAISEFLTSIVDLATSIVGVAQSVVDFVGDIVGVAHGLFNFFVSKIPDLIGKISGLYKWLKDGFGPVISSGFDVIKDTMNTLWAGLKEIVAIAISPIVMAVNALDVILTSIKLFLAEAPVIGDKTKAEQYQKDLAKAMFKLNGADRGGAEEANYKAAAAAFEEALQSGKKDEIETAAAAYKKASAEYQSEAGSKVTAAQIDRRVEAANLGKSLDSFTKAIGSDILKNGPQMDEAAKEEVLQYLSGQKGNITNENVLPSNTGSLLNSITDHSKNILGTLTSILRLLQQFNSNKYATGGTVSKATPAIIGEDGKEIVLNMSKPNEVKKVMSSLSSGERSMISSAASSGLTDKERQIVSKATVGANTSQEYEKAVDTLSKWPGGRMKPAEFFALFGPIAREDMRSTGIPASVTLAQAALESGWGKTAKAEFKNLFGIKGKGNAGSAVVNTHEVYDGVRVQKQDAFAQYLTYLDSITAHSDYLLNAKRKKGLEGLRYGEALTHIFEPNLFAYLLREGGYATSTAYGKKLVNVMRGHDLYKWDVSNLSLKNVGNVQSKLMAKAKENLANASASNERMNQLLREEYIRETERAIIEGKAPPKQMASFAANGGSLTSATIGQASNVNTVSAQANNTKGYGLSEANIAYLDSLLKERLNPNASTNKLSDEEIAKYVADLIAAGYDEETVNKMVESGDFVRMRDEQLKLAKITNSSAVQASVSSETRSFLQAAKAQAEAALSNGGNSSLIAESLGIIVRYLRDISTASKQKSPPAARPQRTVYGT